MEYSIMENNVRLDSWVQLLVNLWVIQMEAFLIAPAVSMTLLVVLFVAMNEWKAPKNAMVPTLIAELVSLKDSLEDNCLVPVPANW